MKQQVLDVVRAEETALAPAGQPPTLMHILQEAVQRGSDVGVIERLVALKERVDKADAEKEFIAAKARLHAKLPQIQENGAIVVNGEVRSRYAQYEDIDQILRPLFDEEGFAIDFDAPKLTGDQLDMTCTLSHRMGHQVTKHLTLPLDKSGAKNGTQSIGSTVSFGKRYLLQMQINLVTRGEDKDGQALEPVDQDQCNRINDLLLSTNSNRGKFLQFMGAAEVDQILKKDYAKAMNALNSKARGR